MGGRSAGERRRIESYLEPSHGGPAVAFGVLAAGMFAVVGAALVYRRSGWPDELQLGIDLPDRPPGGARGTGGAARRRLRGPRRVPRRPLGAGPVGGARSPTHPAVAAHLPVVAVHHRHRPPRCDAELTVDIVDPRDLDDIEPRPRHGDDERGRRAADADRRRPAFENQPRLRTLLEGSWRELGPLVVLRSVASLSPTEVRDAGGRPHPAARPGPPRAGAPSTSDRCRRVDGTFDRSPANRSTSTTRTVPTRPSATSPTAGPGQPPRTPWSAAPTSS